MLRMIHQRFSNLFLVALATTTGLTGLVGCSGGGGGSSAPGPGLEPLTLTVPAVVPAVEEATLSWATSLPTTAVVELGAGEATLQEFHVQPAQQDHSLVLSSLAANRLYRFRVRATASDGRTVTSDFQEFSTLPEPADPEFVSDDFYANNLDASRWEFRDPLGGARLRMLAGATGEGALELSVPPGVVSAPWLTLDAARVTQPVLDEDLGLQVWFTSPLDRQATGKGLIFEQDRDNWARFDFAYNNGKLQLFAAVFANGQLQNMQFSNLQTGPWAGGRLGMRVVRTGNQYVQQYSLDGLLWQSGFTMTSNMTLAHAGVFIASQANPSLGITAVIDSIERTDALLANEDGELAVDDLAPWIYTHSATALGPNAVEVAWRTEEQASAEIRYGRTPAASEGLLTLAALDFEQQSTVNGLQPDSDYYLQVRALDALGQASLQTLQVRTPSETTPGAPTFTLWDMPQDPGGMPVARFGDLGFAQRQVNLLGNVQDDDEDRIAQTVTLEYRLGSGPWTAVALGDDRTISYAPWRLANEGDFNIELFLADLTSGSPVAGVFEHDVLLRATDDEGHTSYQALRLEIADGTVWNPNTTVDWTQVANQSGLPSGGAQVIDGRWHVENVAGLGYVLRTDPDHMGYDRLVGIGEGQGPNAWQNYEVELDATVLALDPQGFTTGTGSFAFGFVLRWVGHSEGGPYAQPNHNIYPLGAGFLYRWFPSRERWEIWTGYDESIQSLPGNQVAIGTRYSMKLRCESLPGGGSNYRMKIWPFGTSEPGFWSFDVDTAVTDTNDFGSLLLVAHHADVAFGNIQVTQLP